MMSKVNLVVALVLVCAVSAHAILGGLNAEQPADDKIRSLVNRTMVQFKYRYPEQVEEVEPVSYRSQLVNGMNYFVKAVAVHADGTRKHIHVRLHESWEGHVELSAIRLEVDEDTEIGFFQ